MTPSHALFPHEKHCERCRGTGTIDGINQPWPCRDCDGTGVIGDDRRRRKRDLSDDLATRLINRLTADRDELRDANTRMRGIIAAQRKLLDFADIDLRPPALEKPHGEDPQEHVGERKIDSQSPLVQEMREVLGKRGEIE